MEWKKNQSWDEYISSTIFGAEVTTNMWYFISLWELSCVAFPKIVVAEVQIIRKYRTQFYQKIQQWVNYHFLHQIMFHWIESTISLKVVEDDSKCFSLCRINQPSTLMQWDCHGLMKYARLLLQE